MFTEWELSPVETPWAPVIQSLCGCFLICNCWTTLFPTREMDAPGSSRALARNCLLSADSRMTWVVIWSVGSTRLIGVAVFRVVDSLTWEDVLEGVEFEEGVFLVGWSEFVVLLFLVCFTVCMADNSVGWIAVMSLCRLVWCNLPHLWQRIELRQSSTMTCRNTVNT